MKRFSRRLIALFSTFCLLFGVVNFRILYLQSSVSLQQAAASQGHYTLEADSVRGQVYDRNMIPLVNQTTVWQAAVMPQPENVTQVLELTDGNERSHVLQLMQQGLPFLTEILPDSAEVPGVTILKRMQRYTDSQPAAHVIGYINGDGEGVSGIEKAYDTFLSEAQQTTTLRYTVDGQGNSLTREPEIVTAGDASQGVVLTIDSDIQKICEYVGNKYITKGAIVVMDPTTGDLLACASFPSYSPNDVASSLEDANAPLVNRCFSAFNVGSTFKTVVAAAELERSGATNQLYYCTGSIDVDGQVYHCYNNTGHDEVDMRTAMMQSCNCYFISLGQTAGAETVREMAKNLSYGRGYELASGYYTDSGNLTTLEELRRSGELANFSFGQGKLTATPVQVTQMMASIAAGGATPSPQLVKGITYDGITVEKQEGAAPLYAMSSTTAETMRSMLYASVNGRDDIAAKPRTASAAGKTATVRQGSSMKTAMRLTTCGFRGTFRQKLRNML